MAPRYCVLQHGHGLALHALIMAESHLLFVWHSSVSHVMHNTGEFFVLVRRYAHCCTAELT